MLLTEDDSVLKIAQQITFQGLVAYKSVAYISLPKKCPYLELFWSAFSHIRIEYGELRSIFPYSVRMRENGDQNNSEYGHFSRSV